MTMVLGGGCLLEKYAKNDIIKPNAFGAREGGDFHFSEEDTVKHAHCSLSCEELLYVQRD